MKIKTVATAFLLASLMMSLSVGIVMAPKISSERFLGYNAQKMKWTTGNLGKDYVEGMFVSYQLRIDESSKVWNATEFSISFNFFQASSGAVYIDGFDTSVETGFQYSTGDFLLDDEELPTESASWVRIPIPTPAAYPLSNPTVTPRIDDYMDAWPEGTIDSPGTSPAKEHYFTVVGIPWGDVSTGHIILFFRAHLTQDIIWSDGHESILPTGLDGDEFNSWTAPWRGSSFATGSSRHFTLQYEGIGKKTIPIPIVQYPTGMISGYKRVDPCNGERVEYPYVGWPITLTQTLFGNVKITKTVLTGSEPWAMGYYEFVGLMDDEYKVEEGMMDVGYWHKSDPLRTVIIEDGASMSEDFLNGYIGSTIPPPSPLP